MTDVRISKLLSHAWFDCKRAFGIFNRQSVTQPWSLTAPLPEARADFFAKWQAKAPRLPIALLDRQYLAPHLEQYSITLGHSPEAEAKAIAVGRFRLTNNEFINLGSPVEWNRDQEGSVTKHWSKISATDNAASALTNEVSQFNWTYPLVRAWILSGDDAPVETFWNLLEDWMEKNPPNLGPQWVSDEVIARRLLAVTFAAQAFRSHPAITDERLSRAAQLISVSARRLKLTHRFVYAQSAVKGLTSSLALFTAGALWPQLPEADAWRSEGLEYLIQKGKKIISDEGQGAVNARAHTLRILEIYSWAEIILRQENEPESLPDFLHKKIRVLATGLTTRQPLDTAMAPLFFLSGCPLSDVRPALATALILFTGARNAAGPWDESTLILLGPMCASASIS